MSDERDRDARMIDLAMLLDSMCVLIRQNNNWAIVGPFFKVESPSFSLCVQAAVQRAAWGLDPNEEV